MKKKIIIIISIVAVLLLVAWLIYHFWGTKTEAYYWRSVPIDRGDVNVIVTATGSMAADTSVDVGVQVSGTIAKINVDFNNIVKKGQVIAILDTTLYYAAKVDALAGVQKAEVALDAAKRDLDRSQSLFDRKFISQADFDQVLTTYKTAQTAVISAQALLNRANINLQYCTVKAPISGMVIARNVQVGNMVIASFNSPVLFTIAYDLKKMQVQANVDEADIGQVKEGQLAKFTVNTYPNNVFEGVVTQVRHQPVMVQNVVNYVVIISVQNPNLMLMPGLTANSNIYIQAKKNVLKIPTNVFTFTPPLEYIQQSQFLPDSTKKFWIKRLSRTGQIKKQQIVESEGATGYLWLVSDKDVFPVEVRKGLNDGAFTEIEGNNIQEGYEVATGINHSAPATDTKTTNPFMPKMPSRRR